MKIKLIVLAACASIVPCLTFGDQPLNQGSAIARLDLGPSGTAPKAAPKAVSSQNQSNNEASQADTNIFEETGGLCSMIVDYDKAVSDVSRNVKIGWLNGCFEEIAKKYNDNHDAAYGSHSIANEKVSIAVQEKPSTDDAIMCRTPKKAVGEIYIHGSFAATLISFAAPTDARGSVLERICGAVKIYDGNLIGLPVAGITFQSQDL